jgi:hypothetical protein
MRILNIMNNICEYKTYHSFSSVIMINDSELKQYLSNIIKKFYVNELNFIKKDDVIENYQEIFNFDYTDDLLKSKLIKLKSIIDNNQPIIDTKRFDEIYNGGWYGC